MSYNSFAYAAVLIESVAFILYFISIFKGETKPKWATWFLWTLVALLEIKYGQESSTSINTIFIWCHAFWYVTTFALSLKYGENEIEIVDVLVLVGVLVSFVIRVICGAKFTFGFMIAVDFLAFLPTLNQGWRNPQREDLVAWQLSALAAVINLGSAPGDGWVDVAYPIITIVMTLGLVLVLTLTPNRRALSK